MIKIPDIPLSAITKIAGGQGAPFQNTLLPSIPPALLNAPAGTLVNALVTGGGAGGIFTLKTPYGLLSIQTTLPLQHSNTLTFQLVRTDKEVALLLQTVNGQTVNKPKNQVETTLPGGAEANKPLVDDPIFFTIAPKYRQPPQSQPQTQPQTQLQSAVAITTESPALSPGISLQATLSTVYEEALNILLTQLTFDAPAEKLLPAITQVQPQAIPPNIIIKPGAVFSFQLVDITLPVPATSQVVSANNTTALPVIPNSAIPVATPALPENLPLTVPSVPILVSATPLLPGDDAVLSLPDGAPLPHAAAPTSPVRHVPSHVVTAGVVTLPDPTIPPAVASRVSGPPLVAATVISAEPSGPVLIKTPFGTLTLELNTSLPRNTTLYLELSAIIPAPISTAPTFTATTNAKADSIPQLIKHWASLEEAIQTVQQANPSLTEQILQKLPTPDNQFGVKLVHFIKALQLGSVSEWLGPEFVKTLQQEKKTELLTQLTKEFVTLRSALSEPAPTTQWQTLIFPVFTEGALHQARMYIRTLYDEEKQQQKGHEKSAMGARFVVEIELEKLGSMQFDGLVKQVDNGKFFDLVIRSHMPLNADMTSDIREIFTTIQEMTGLKGRISFEHTAHFPVNPSEEILARGGGNAIEISC